MYQIQVALCEQALVRFTADTYEGSAFMTALLEQYRLYVQSAENVSARRIATSHYLLAVNAALVVLFGGMLSADLNGLSSWVILVPGVGIAVSLLWHSLIDSYSDLNAIKFRVIHELEEHLPAALYQYEWELIKNGKETAYKPVTALERLIPILFVVLHSVVVGVLGSGLIAPLLLQLL